MKDLFDQEESHPTIAPRHARVFGACIDYFAYFLLLFLFYGNWSVPIGADIGLAMEVTNPDWFACLLLWLIVFVGPEAWKGQTLGKKLMRVQVLSVDERKPSFVQCLVRHLFDVVDWLPFLGIVGILVSSSNPLRKRVGDHLAGTIVVDYRKKTKLEPEGIKG